MRFLIPLAFAAGPAICQDFQTQLVVDLTGDGIADRAELVETHEGGDATLNIWVKDRLVVNALALVWVGGAGQQPELSVTPHGSLQVTSMNIAIGRNRWEEVLTIALRDDQFKIAGYTYSWYDTLNLDDQGQCDVNLLTGKGIVEIGPDRVQSTLRTKIRAMPVADWPRNILPDCAQYLP